MVRKKVQRRKAPQERRGDHLIEMLNEVLAGELVAINQYFFHAEMCEHWGFERLHQAIRAQSIGEMAHAEQLIKRMLHLEGTPNVQRLGKVNIGKTVPEQLRLDLDLEREALPRLNDGIALCRERADNGTRIVLEEILRSEEEHIDWIEAQVNLISQVGLQNYLAQQITGGGQ